MVPTDDAPRLPRSTRGAWRAPSSASRRAPERPRQTELPGLQPPSEVEILEDVEEAPSRPAVRRRSVPRATAGADVREIAVTRRRLLPRSRFGWIVAGVVMTVLVGMLGAAVYLAHRYILQNVHFYLDGSQNIRPLTAMEGNASQVTRSEILSVFGQDIGRNIFFVPLAERRRELESIAWVRKATVMRILPNHLYVQIAERTPIAFARVGDTVELVDADGVLLPISPARMALHSYSFPVVSGLNVHPSMASAKERMALYQRFLADLDHVQPHASAEISEIDLSDPDDLRATLSDSGSDLLVHFGAENFAARYQMYRSHIAEWHAHYPRLIGMDLRFPGDVPLQLASDTPNAANGVSGNAAVPNADHGVGASGHTAAQKLPVVASRDQGGASKHATSPNRSHKARRVATIKRKSATALHGRSRRSALHRQVAVKHKSHAAESASRGGTE